MPVTPDLKDNEFEITVLCPIGACLFQHTYAYDNGLLELPASDLIDVKGRITEMVTKAHKEGGHAKKA